MSQHDLHTIIRQQQKQLAAMQTQIQALITRGARVGAGEEEREATGYNMGPQMCYKTRVWTDFRVRVRTLGNY